MSIQISVLVFIGNPLDSPSNRHTALFLADPDGKTALVYVAGTQNFFTCTEHTGYIPETEPGTESDLAGVIPVAELPDSIGVSTALLKSAIMSTPINNSDREWNCQNWVCDALARLVGRGFIDSSQRERACNAMVDVCLEAKYEE